VHGVCGYHRDIDDPLEASGFDPHRWPRQEAHRDDTERDSSSFGSIFGQTCRETHNHGPKTKYREDKFTHNVLFASCLQLQYQSGQVEIDFLTDQQIAVEIEICD
jgi:hypothetical protein